MTTTSPRFLLIDAGNTRVKWATAPIRGPIRIAGEIATGDATVKWISSLSRKYAASLPILSTVVPKLRSPFRQKFGPRLIDLTSALPELGLRFNYPKPQEIGADRLAAAVAAQALGHFPAIVVSCGTATAFTVLDGKGRLSGGAIAPGLQTQLSALLGATAQLPATFLKQPRSALAKSTSDAIRAGVMLSFQGGIEEILLALIHALPAGSNPDIILTGGNARHLVEYLEIPFKLRPLLVFEGLRMIALRRSQTS